MRARRQIRRAAQGLSACVAALLLVGQPAFAGGASAKADRLVVSPSKGDLFDAKPASVDSARPSTVSTSAAAAKPAFAGRGTAARRLIDVAVRDDGVWLNSFATRSMPLDAPACAELSEEIVSRLPVSAVERLADEDLMRQTRVCGVNGSLLVTCYGGSATVSLRPSAMGDGCR
jgi:hypothetical protein